MGNGVKIIGYKCFSDISELTTITISESVERIRNSAFLNCLNLTKVTIPASVNYIEDEIFSGCENLTSDGVISNSHFLFDWWIWNHQYNGQTMSQMSEIDFCLLKNSDERNFSIICSNAFLESKILKSVILCSSLKEIGFGAFRDCSNLKEITFPVVSELETIDWNAFDGCENLTRFFIPSSVTKIDSNVFENCKKLTSDNVINNSPVLFDWWVCNHQYNGQTMSQMSEINLSQFKNSDGKKFSVIGNGAFNKCENLNKIVIPESINHIFNNAFFSCENLKSVTFQGNNKGLHLELFSFLTWANTTYWFESWDLCNRLKETEQLKNAKIDEDHCIITVEKSFVLNGQGILTKLTYEGKQKTFLIVPNFTNTIAPSAFQGSQAVTIYIPASVKTIGESAFGSCQKLTNITFIGQSKLATIGNSAFYGTNLTSIVIPGLVSEIGARAFDNCNHLESVTFLGQNRKFSLGKEAFPQNINQFYFNDKNLFNSLILETGAGIISSKCVLFQEYFEIKDDNSLIAITSDAQELSELRIPGFVKTIGDGTNVVFGESAKFQKVIIPTSVDKIKANAFNGCSSLKEVIINSTDITIESNAFVNMPSTQYYVPANADVKEQLKKIGIKESQIYFLNLSAISIDYATIGIIVGAVVFSIIALGLGIGIPIMRKQHRINMLNAKITRNRVDKLAAATALSFKKVLEVSAKTNGKIDKLQSSLISAKVARPVNRLSQPNRPANPKPPIKKPAKK